MREIPQSEWVLGTVEKEIAFEEEDSRCPKCGSNNCVIDGEDPFIVFMKHYCDCGVTWDLLDTHYWTE